jgi:hypothetical protein
VEKVFLDNEVTVSFNIYTKDRQTYDSKRYVNTELRAWKIEQGDTTVEVKQQPKQNGEFTPTFAVTNQDTF